MSNIVKLKGKAKLSSYSLCMYLRGQITGADGIGRYLNELMHIESGHNIPEIKALKEKEKQEKE